jgi:hypothetical protein
MNYLAKKHIFLEKGKSKPKKAVLRQAQQPPYPNSPLSIINY